MGVVGLQNLGNSCFMNAAVQCLSNVQGLTEYFLSGEFVSSVNPINPLGTSGRLAHAYAELLENLWRGSSSTFSPRRFKKVLSHFATQFAGYQQQDSHELLYYVLDGLHEDLNRVSSKPYCDEGLESHGDDEAALAHWSRHLSRNRSVVVDLMHGQYKSTVLCPVCNHYSYSFDPFNSLSLPLPGPQEFRQSLYFVFADPRRSPLSMSVTLPEGAVIAELLVVVAKELLVSEKNIVCLGVMDNAVKDFYEPGDSVESLASTTLFSYEIDEKKPQCSLFEVQLVRGTGKTRLIAYPRVLQVPRTASFRVLHIEIYALLREFFSRNRTRGGNLQREYEEFLGQPAYSLRFAGGRLRTCAFCADKACKGCSIPYSGSTIEVLTTEKMITIELVFAAGVPVAYQDMNKCNEHMPHMQKAGQKPAVSLEECMRLLSEPEHLDAANTWYCKTCKRHVQATKKLEIFKSPKVLIVHLKRFKHSVNVRGKLTTPVTFPESGLDLSGMVIGPERPRNYDLIGVVNHYGSLSSGHYTATCKNSHKNMWVEFNDSHLAKAPAFSPTAAYILFYHERPN